jgi:hypothetical protein
MIFAWEGPRAGAAEPAAAQFHQDIQPILREYCYQCHGDGMSKGNVAFDELNSDSEILNQDLWSKALGKLRAGLMPPQGEKRPGPAELQRVEDWIKYGAFGIDRLNPDPGRVTLRRLNRVEYRNTIRDLTGVDFNTDDEFPPDDTGYGFDDIGDVLTVSPMLLEKYIKAATTIVDQAVPKVSKVMPQIKIAGGRFHGAEPASGNGRGGGGGRGGRGGRGGADTLLGLSYYKAATVSNTFEAQFAGNYQLSLELSVRGTFEFDPGKCHVIFKVDGRDLLSRDFAWEDNKIFPPFVYDQKWQAGPHRMSFEIQPLTPEAEKVQSQLDLRIDSLTIAGPMDEMYWTRPKNYDLFFTKEPPQGASDRLRYAREVLGDFALKAFRRPVDAKTVDRLAALAQSVYKQPGKTFEQGVGYAMIAVLSSPRFLFRTEEAQKTSSKDPYPLVDEYSLASRLSYFLWSSMPDQELFRLAAQGELRKNLPAQIKRMLADPRSEAMVENFTGQWLQVRDVEGITIDARTVLARDKGEEKQLQQQIAGLLAGNGKPPAQPNASSQAKPPDKTANPNNFNGKFSPPAVQLTPDVRHAMERETQLAFSTIMREDRSVSELIESDYTFLNQSLAKFYGLTNLDVTGTNMRRVDLPPDSPRGGVLTEGAFLVVTSNPDRTSPVKRGLFVLNNILGSPPPPPPPNIPALEVAEKNFHDHEPTLRETLQEHRDKPECAACHSRLDPVGLAFENFNALGLWRERERGQAIEPAGQLITGESFKDVRELKHILAANHREEFYRTLTTKLLTYATGRGLENYDTETVDQIVRRMDAEDGRFSALLTGIIDSAPFQKERRQAIPALSDTPQNSPANNVSVNKKDDTKL